MTRMSTTPSNAYTDACARASAAADAAERVRDRLLVVRARVEEIASRFPSVRAE
jgi:hypothetical protein